jgi:hypothetical protein
MGCTYRKGQAEPSGPGPPGSSQCRKTNHSHFNIGERNSDTFPIQKNQVHFWALCGVVKTPFSTIMCETEKLWRAHGIELGSFYTLLSFFLSFLIRIKSEPWLQLTRSGR